MKKLIVSVVAAASLVASVAYAQSYYYPTSTGSCASISSTLSVGSRGSQVLALQQFLVSQSYPGGGAWMETGYFGTATRAAVVDFQQSRGLPQTGAVDAATLSALQNCNTSYTYPGTTSTTYPSPFAQGYGGTQYGTTYPYTTSPYTTYPTYPTTTYPYTYPYNYTTGTPVITSLSQNTGTPGESVTIYGQNFSPSYDTVNFGGQSVASTASSATSLTFTIPYTSTSYGTNETLEISVTDAGGTSNAISFTLNPSGCSGYSCGTCTTYPYSYGYTNSSCGCTTTYPYTSNLPTGQAGCGTCGSTYSTYPYTSGCQGNTNSPTITYLNPQSGAVGMAVTVYGSGFTTNGNTVHFGSGILTGLGSADGQSVSFIVPAQLTGFGSQPVTLGTYNVSVTNANNITTNAVPFTVTSLNSIGNNGAPTITSVSGPTNLSVSQQGTWTFVINSNGASYTTVSASWGDTGNGYVNQAAPQVIYGSQTVTFTHAYVSDGTFTLTFTASNLNGQSNTYTSTVNVTGSLGNGGTPTITYISPSSANIGSQVTIYGSNFSTSNNNTVYLGSGAIESLTSNGSSLTFTVPSYTTPYCTPGLLCGVQPTQVTPGTYNVSVMDQYGTSNIVPFTVL